jgi:putative transposase
VAVCCKLGVCAQTCDRWKRQFAGMGIGELQQLRQLEEENRQRTQLVVALTWDQRLLREVLRQYRSVSDVCAT